MREYQSQSKRLLECIQGGLDNPLKQKHILPIDFLSGYYFDRSRADISSIPVMIFGEDGQEWMQYAHKFATQKGQLG